MNLRILFSIVFFTLFSKLSAYCQGVNSLNDFQINQITSNQNNPSALSEVNSQIYISQVGAYNTNQTSVSSPDYRINYTQSGYENEILIVDGAFGNSLKINQYGLRNTVSKFNLNTFAIINTSVIQQGENQDLTIFGENSISQAMKIRMTGENQSLTIRNFY